MFAAEESRHGVIRGCVVAQKTDKRESPAPKVIADAVTRNFISAGMKQTRIDILTITKVLSEVHRM